MEEKLINQAYEIAKERYANIGIDTDKVGAPDKPCGGLCRC